MQPDPGFEMCERLSRHNDRCQSLFYDGFISKMALVGNSPRHVYNDERNTLPGVGAHPDYSGGNEETGVDVARQAQNQGSHEARISTKQWAKRAQMGGAINQFATQQAAMLPTTPQNGAPTPAAMQFPMQPGAPTNLANTQGPRQPSMESPGPGGAEKAALSMATTGEGMGDPMDSRAIMAEMLKQQMLAGDHVTQRNDVINQGETGDDYNKTMENYKARLTAARG